MTSNVRSVGGLSHLALECKVALRVCETINSPLSLGIALRLKYASEDPSLWMEIAKAKFDVRWYEPFYRHTVTAVADDYLATNLLKKSPNLPVGIDREAATLDAFFKAEDICRETNARLHEAARAGSHPPWFWEFRSQFRRLVGPLTSEGLNKIWGLCRMGKGSTVGHETRSAGGITQRGAFAGPVTFPSNLPPLFIPALIRTDLDFTEVEGEQWFSVPKNALVNRGCAKQPTISVLLQQGIGRYMRESLLLKGFDIRDQGRNQTLAKEAYAKGLATMDLSMASDLISYELIRQVADPRWFHLWNLARVTRCRLPTGNKELPLWVTLERYCSMGNAFTFPLETALFAAVCRTFVPRSRWGDVAVYGDDIIVPAEWYDDVESALEYLGFRVNELKSYRGGYFFESCGHDYFLGHDIRPFYLRKVDPSEALEEGMMPNQAPYALQIANALRRYAYRRGALGCCDRRWEPLWNLLRKKVPHSWRVTVPPVFGDTGLIGPRPKHVKRTALGIEVSYIPSRGVEPRGADRFTVVAALAAMDRSFRDPGRELDNDTMLPLFETPPWLEGLVLTPWTDIIRGQLQRPCLSRTHIQRWEEGWEWL